MPSFNFILTTIIMCGLVTFISRVTPFVLLKKFQLPAKVVDLLSFVPIVIMSALWFESLFHQNLGHLPSLDYPNLLASLPTVISAILTKSLVIIVIVGIASLALIQLLALN